jgi:hypothetical protein
MNMKTLLAGFLALSLTAPAVAFEINNSGTPSRADISPAFVTAQAAPIVGDATCVEAISTVREHITQLGARLDATAAVRAENALSRAAGADSAETCFRAVERAAGLAGFDGDLG